MLALLDKHYLASRLDIELVYTGNTPLLLIKFYFVCKGIAIAVASMPFQQHGSMLQTSWWEESFRISPGQIRTSNFRCWPCRTLVWIQYIFVRSLQFLWDIWLKKVKFIIQMYQVLPLRPGGTVLYVDWAAHHRPKRLLCRGDMLH